MKKGQKGHSSQLSPASKGSDAMFKIPAEAKSRAMEDDRLLSRSRTPVAFEGVIYNLCGEFDALVEAEAFFNAAGNEVNLAEAILNVPKGRSFALSAIRQMFPCALRAFHPEITFAAAQGMIARMGDDAGIIQAVGTHMWPARTQETDRANENLTFDFQALSEANHFFGGKTGLIQICVEEPFTLGHVYRVFPCALHRYRPDLTLDAARQLMTLPSVIVVVKMLELAWQAASQETRDKFVERVTAAASDQERQEVGFRILAKRLSPGAAQA